MAPLVVDPSGYLKPHHSVGHCPMASGICPVADSRTARWWPAGMPGGGQLFEPSRKRGEVGG